MVLEDSLLFNSAEDADTFIKFLRKRGCKAHKKPVMYSFEEEEVSGPLDGMISYLQSLENRESPDGDEGPVKTIVLQRVDKLLLGRGMLERLLSSHEVGDVLFTEDEVRKCSQQFFRYIAEAAYPLMKKEMEERGHELPPRDPGPAVSEEEAREAGAIVFADDTLRENGMVSVEGGNVRLVKKGEAGGCRVSMNTMGLGPIDADEIAGHGISSSVNLYFDALFEVTMDGSVLVECSVNDIEEGLEDLEVDEESLEEFFAQYELKRLAIMGVMGVVQDAGRISFSGLEERLVDYPMDLEELAEPVRLTLEPAFLSSLVSGMRKLGYLSGSQENIRLGK